MRFRDVLLLAHRWVGLATAGFLAIAGLTGAVIAFNHELDAWLNPELFRVPATSAPRPALELVAALEAADPRLEASYFPLAAEPGHSLSVFVRGRVDPRSGAERVLGFDQVFLDPSTGERLGERTWGAFGLDRKHLIPFLYRLHYSLHLPEAWGLWAMGIVGLLWTVDCIVGFVLTLPARSRRATSGAEPTSASRRSFWIRWAPAWRVRTDAGPWRANVDVHRAAGLWFWPVLFTIAASGVYLNLGDELVRPALSSMIAITPTPFDEVPSRAPAPLDGEARLAVIGALVRDARQVAATRDLSAPYDVFHSREYGVFGVGLGDHHAPGLGVPYLFFDHEGRLVSAMTPETTTLGDKALAALFPLHSGNAIGLPGRILIAITGVAVALLSATGVLIWVRRRLKQRRAVPVPQPSTLRSSTR